jgi:predicted CXXCH cytochrome family protein
MKLVYTLAFAVAFAVATPTFAAAPSEPNVLKAKNGDVTFNHKTHAKLECTKCHADAKGGKLAPMGKDKGHAACVDCHKAEAKGPSKCAECHKKA